ncbi:hypothetical protein SKAU_G00235240 [Synaphobranchus kaupii]|uniref:Gypsy retrotransposon integrase-like protein 1 n=1 Tax=Synaphobranchus kaupii TaxID=118154 RepID=A0A9Q1F6K0_SYNKA|nr:hypothetical protein SKAU_G00235240 [Synaphobranchus kaupii]
MDLLHTGIIRKCNSTYSSPVWPVLKASGKWRLTVDYRQLNKQVCLSRWPMAYLDETLTKVQNAAYFTSLDISNGFWTIPVREEDQHKLAFSFNNVQYTWTVTPFGYANSPAEFNIFLHKAIPDVNSRNIAIYVDDILMWSDSWTAHRELLSYVLTRLSVAGAKISLDKGQWCKRAVNYLGFQVGHEGIRPQLNRTLALQTLPAPTTLKQLRSFLGICNFSRHFVADYAKIAQPLTRLLKKDTPWHWGQEQDAAMRTLKDSISAAPALAFPDKTKPFILETAFTPLNISVVLKQQQDQQKRVVSYASKSLSPVEQRFTDYSDYTVRSSIDYLPHWLANDMKKSDGKPVAHTELFIAIQHLLDTTNLTVFWKKIPGHSKLDGPDKAGNDRADALAKEGVSTGQPWEFCNPASQFSQPTDNSSVTIGTSELRNTQREADTPLFPQPPAQVDVVTRSRAKAPDPHNPSNSNRITLITPEAHNDLVQAQEKDQALTHLIRILQDTTSVADSGDLINDAYFQVLWKQKERLSLRDGLLTFKGTNDQHCRWVVPRQWRITMMQHTHDEPCGGHRGEQSTISMLRQVAYWPKMWTDVKDYVNSCLTCCKFQPVLPRHRAPLQSTPTTQPWSYIQIDWIGPITRSSRGNQYALTVTDMFTKWVECLPAPRDTAESTAVRLMNHVFTRWCLPQSVNSDRGTHFTSTIMEQVWKTLGVKRQLHVAYRPQSSGQVERANQTVINMLKKYLSVNQRDWDIKLPLILMAIRATPSRATQVSPFEMMTGRQMVLLLHLLYTPTTGSAPEAVQTTSYLEELGRHLQSIFEFARQNMKTEAIRVKSYYDRKACDREYEVGDEAFYYHFSRNQKRSKKLLPSWQGPYAITDKLSPVVYRIKMPTMLLLLLLTTPGFGLQTPKIIQAGPKAGILLRDDPGFLSLDSLQRDLEHIREQIQQQQSALEDLRTTLEDTVLLVNLHSRLINSTITQDASKVLCGLSKGTTLEKFRVTVTRGPTNETRVAIANGQWLINTPLSELTVSYTQHYSITKLPIEPGLITVPENSVIHVGDTALYHLDHGTYQAEVETIDVFRGQDLEITEELNELLAKKDMHTLQVTVKRHSITYDLPRRDGAENHMAGNSHAILSSASIALLALILVLLHALWLHRKIHALSLQVNQLPPRVVYQANAPDPVPSRVSIQPY